MISSSSNLNVEDSDISNYVGRLMLVARSCTSTFMNSKTVHSVCHVTV